MRAARLALAVLVALLLAVAMAAAALWLWSGTGGSLAAALGQAARLLPAGATLEAGDASGTLREGGRVDWLRWQQDGLSVEARGVEVGWSLRPLLEGELRLGRLSIAHLRIDDRRPAREPRPPTDLVLPLRVDVPFSVGTVEWVGPPSLTATELTGNYIFNSKEHRIHADNIRISSGIYGLEARLQAHAPLALDARLTGQVTAPPPTGGQPVKVHAEATVRGNLGGRDAALDLMATLHPELRALASGAMQASVTARIQPWQPQPVTRAAGVWRGLDLAALWPAAPMTELQGQATVTPAGAGWQATIAATNLRPGPWDRQRLPIDHLEARLAYASGQWAVQSLKARGAGGHAEAQGQLADPRGTAWQVQATLHAINPQAVDSRLAATALDGQLTARQTPAGVAFEVNARPATGAPARGARPDPVAGLRLRNAHARGLWQSPLLTLDTLRVQTDDAQLQGHLRLHPGHRSAEGRLELRLPGTDATAAGHIASDRGQGELNARMADAALTSRWLARWPGIPAPWKTLAAQGTAELQGRWQGGWQQQGRTLQLQATLRAPRLDLQPSGEPVAAGWHLRDLQADLGGNLRALSLSMRGTAATATQRFALQAQASGGRLEDGLWQAMLETAQLTAQDSQRPGTWTLQLTPGLRLDWKPAGDGSAWTVSAGSARLAGPMAGVASLDWQPLRGTRAGTRSEWRSQGRVTGLPLAWIDALGRTRLANLGLKGDLVFGGQWEATGGESLRLRAELARSAGDLQLQTEDATTLSAGVREARLLISADGDRIGASLRWDSERAGELQAEAGTRLTRSADGWTWAADAPVSGTLRARLPRVGAWSLLAPPGWRLRGTLDADATLAGTRAAPLWRGTLLAQDLALRSVVDGLDFSNGVLRARLDGQRLEIEQFTLQGAGGAGGGQMTAQGAVQWLPPGSAPGPAASRLRMDLTAEARALRVSARADRRLVVSGQLTARLADARLAIRGNLKADQALFVLPEDTAPRLGDDVVVRRAGASTDTVAAAPRSAGARVVPDVAVTLDLGPDFQVRGLGLATRLAGTLELRSTSPTALEPRLSGEVRTVRGTYRAYGQLLDIEEGVLRFTGPYNNPALDILAIRPNLSQRVGVQISGTALSPVVRLYADPELPEAEKLAWLVLGRQGASGGAEVAVLQQAALSLLGGNKGGLSGGLATALGLDELSVRTGSVGTDGTTSGATVTLGKRVSNRFYVAYERSLAGTLGTFYIFYDLSRRITLRAQTGEQSAVDLIFTWRYD